MEMGIKKDVVFCLGVIKKALLGHIQASKKVQILITVDSSVPLEAPFEIFCLILCVTVGAVHASRSVCGVYPVIC